MQRSFAARHDDVVCDLAYDHYGTRIATGSADHCVKVRHKRDVGRGSLREQTAVSATQCAEESRC